MALDPLTRSIPPTAITIPPDRQRSDAKADEDMIASIRETGLINPIVVRRGEEPEAKAPAAGDTAAPPPILLVAGERRLRACLALNLPTIPVRFLESMDPADAEAVELEENVKRLDLPWRDHARSLARFYELFVTRNPDLSPGQQYALAAKRLAVSEGFLRMAVNVNRHIANPKLSQAASISAAANILARIADRAAENIVSNILIAGTELFQEDKDNDRISVEVGNDPTAPVGDQGKLPGGMGGKVHPPAPTSVTARTAKAAAVAGDAVPPETAPNAAQPSATSDPVICADFLTWAPTYSGPKFTLIHCDFPYGVFHAGNQGSNSTSDDLSAPYDNDPELYWALVDCLTENLDRLMSYQAHLVFWFSMKYYTETKERLTRAGLAVQDHPLVWHKSDGRGIAPWRDIYPKRTYDTALLASRGNRPLVKQFPNSHSAPCPTPLRHPSQKSEPMLRAFLAGLVDETTSVLDPTCGSGSALRAAEDCGAKMVLGLERDPDFARDALIATRKARILRASGR